MSGSRSWFDGIEAAFSHFDGVPLEVLLDNARALIDHPDAATREVRFNARLRAFAKYGRFKPPACAPFRARTKGKDKGGVGYVKRNAIAGHTFTGWAGLEAYLVGWSARSLTYGSMARPASHRCRGSGGRKRRRCARWCAECSPTAASR